MNCGGEKVAGESSEIVTKIGMTLLNIFISFFFVSAQCMQYSSEVVFC